MLLLLWVRLRSHVLMSSASSFHSLFLLRKASKSVCARASARSSVHFRVCGAMHGWMDECLDGFCWTRMCSWFVFVGLDSMVSFVWYSLVGVDTTFNNYGRPKGKPRSERRSTVNCRSLLGAQCHHQRHHRMV